MTEKNSEMVRLDANNDNWTCCDTAVAILNTESTLHDRIAFCWNLANQLHVLSELLAQHENREIQDVAALFGGQLKPLEAMLHNLGSGTPPSGDSKPNAEKSCSSDKAASTEGLGAVEQ
jgi:hypothetical protein